MLARRFLAVVAAILPAALTTVWAGSLEFRSDGFFASPDARIKLSRESRRADAHLDVDGEPAIFFVGPILQPGYNTLQPSAIKTEVDVADRLLVESGTLGKSGVLCRRTYSDYMGGVLMRLDYEPVDSHPADATLRLLMPVARFADHGVRWSSGKVTLPSSKPADNHYVFLNDYQGQTNLFRFDLGNGRELGMKFLSPIKSALLADCRQWNEANYHLQTTFEGHSLLVFLCLLDPAEPFPEVDAPAALRQAAPRNDARGAVVPLLDGRYEVVVERAGSLQVLKQMAPLFSIEAPLVRQGGSVLSFNEPLNFDVKDNRIEVVSGAKGTPGKVHQILSVTNDDRVLNSVRFENPGDNGESRIEVSLPGLLFAGQTLLAGKRFIELPARPEPGAVLVSDWQGQLGSYGLTTGSPDQITLFCETKLRTSLSSTPQGNSPAFTLAMNARDNVVNYSLRFAPQTTRVAAPEKGNLLSAGASFETGPDGVRPFASHSWNEKMVDESIPPAFDPGTAVDGVTSLRLTAQDGKSLGDPRGFAFVGAVFNRTQLKRDHDYTLSVWMKADRPGVKAVLYCGENTWGGNNWGSFPVSTEWARHHVSFRASDLEKSGWFLTWAGLAPECKEGRLWLDAVQLEEGGLSDFRPANEIEYGVTPVEKLVEAGRPCEAVLSVRNNGKARKKLRLRYEIRDYWDREVRSSEGTVEVGPESTTTYPVNFGLLPPGYYRGRLTAADGPAKELIFGVYEPQPLTPLPDDWPLACHNDPTPLVRKIGFGAVRAFEIFEMSDIAPEKGRFDFSRADRMVARAEQCGLKLLPILGEFRWPSYRPEPPVPPYATKDIASRSNGEGTPTRLVWPAMTAWKDYVEALTRHYRGRITDWEVLNEPNLVMTAQQYLPYLQAAHEAAKAGNPDCRVVGVCATTDFAGKPGSFVESLLDLGAAPYLDVLSVHLYDTRPPEKTLGLGSAPLLQNWRGILETKHGRRIPVWNTEKSWSSRELGYSQAKNPVPVDYCEEPQFLIDTFRNKAEFLIRETLLDAVAGGPGRFFWFGSFNYEASFITIRPFQPYGLHHTEFDQSPCPELIAANGLARALDGMSHPFRLLTPRDSVRACVFTGEKGSMVALWDWETTSRLTLPVGKASFTLRNFFGEPIEAALGSRGELTVELEGAPKYLVLPGLDGESACRLIDGH